MLAQQDSILTTGGVPQYPCKVSCTAVWGDDTSEISFQRVIEKEGGRTKFSGKKSNAVQSGRVGECYCKGRSFG